LRKNKPTRGNSADPKEKGATDHSCAPSTWPTDQALRSGFEKDGETVYRSCSTTMFHALDQDRCTGLTVFLNPELLGTLGRILLNAATSGAGIVPFRIASTIRRRTDQAVFAVTPKHSQSRALLTRFLLEHNRYKARSQRCNFTLLDSNNVPSLTVNGFRQL
jgi:hypothetical protein